MAARPAATDSGGSDGDGEPPRPRARDRARDLCDQLAAIAVAHPAIAAAELAGVRPGRGPRPRPRLPPPHARVGAVAYFMTTELGREVPLNDWLSFHRDRILSLLFQMRQPGDPSPGFQVS